MCGIAGYKCNKNFDPDVIQSMVQALYHRGPDSEGFYKTDMFSAGMRRLSINDLISGDQPLFNNDKSVVVFYNGEIYNSPQLRKDLEAKGYKFLTNSDGEVICHLYDEYKENLFEMLDGMFAIALWVEKEEKLILCRDIPGEKPLYYSCLAENGIAYASEIKSLIKFPGLDLTLNKQAIWDFPTFLWIPEPETVYKSIKALLPSHFLIADKNGIRVKSYKNGFNVGDIGFDDVDIINETRRVVTDAIKTRLLSDVTVGSFLSSGLDSSIITSVAAKEVSDLQTFTIGFDSLSDPYHGKADESEYAKEFARHLGVDHHLIHISSGDFKNDLLNFCKYGDQPFSVSSGLGILAIARYANEMGIKVLLSGDGADECFGGYSWYFYLDRLKKNQQALKDNDLNVSFQNFGLDINNRLDRLGGYNDAQLAWAWHYYASESEKFNLYNADFFENEISSLRFFKGFKTNKKTWQPEDFIKQDREFYFPFEMLRKVDRMTMAFSVEGRAPFAAPSVLAHADKLKYSQMVRGNSLKWVLRKAFESELPKQISQRPKHGFNVPIDHWLKNEWSDLLEQTFSSESMLFKLNMITKNSWDIAFNMINHKERLNGHTLFSYIMLNMWLETNHGNYC